MPKPVAEEMMTKAEGEKLSADVAALRYEVNQLAAQARENESLLSRLLGFAGRVAAKRSVG